MNVTDDNDYYFEIKPKLAFSLNLKELIEYKELFYFFTWRDVKVKYKQTALGFIWAILQPLIMMAIFTFFIGNAMDVPSDDIKYPVFAFSGLILWTVFSSGITNAGNSMVSNAQIIKKIYFPRLVIPISSILVSIFDFLIAFMVFIVLIVLYHQPVNVLKAFIFWPTALLVTVIATFGPGCLLAALNVKYRDFRYVIPFLVQALLFLTPVIYPISIISNVWLKYLLVLNPMYAAIILFRMPMMKSAPDYSLVLISFISGLILFFIGLAYFRKTEMYFADLA
ncbi:MAG: ABC transporter permease [Cyclobacteriaceae bacterium]|nr:ABC transporter permease [Cyclobacteriaceae bacterium]